MCMSCLDTDLTKTALVVVLITVLLVEDHCFYRTSDSALAGHVLSLATISVVWEFSSPQCQGPMESSVTELFSL